MENSSNDQERKGNNDDRSESDNRKHDDNSSKAQRQQDQAEAMESAYTASGDDKNSDNRDHSSRKPMNNDEYERSRQSDASKKNKYSTLNDGLIDQDSDQKDLYEEDEDTDENDEDDVYNGRTTGMNESKYPSEEDYKNTERKNPREDANY